MNLKIDASQKIVSSIMPVGHSTVSESDSVSNGAAIVIDTEYRDGQGGFAPECWRNFVTGTAFSLNNFDRAF